MSLRRLLAVTHEATITGAPMNLLHLLTWIRQHTDVETHLLVVSDGPLRHRFEQVTDVTILDRSMLAKGLGLTQRGLHHLGSSRAWRPVAAARLLPQLRHLDGYDVVYLNSLASLSVAPYLPPARQVVSHVHELQVALRTMPPHERDLLSSLPQHWIAASGAVRDLLVDEVGLADERVLLHYEYIDVRPFGERGATLRETERLRRELRIPAEAAIVMGAGTVDWRKGADLFVQVAAETRRRSREPIHFIWVGGDLRGTDFQRVRSDMERTGADHVHFVGVKPEPLPWFALADVFALTSREDPFPLVCLEHAVMGHPIVTYRNGGIPELLEAAGPEAATGVIDHLDAGAFADQLISLLGSDALRRAATEQVRRRVLERHSVETAAPQLVADLERLLDGPPQPGPDVGSASGHVRALRPGGWADRDGSLR